MNVREFTAEEHRILNEALRTDKRDAPKQSSKDEQRIAELAKLSPLAYDRCRKAEAERLGVRAGELDRAVKAERGKNGSAQPGKVACCNLLRLYRGRTWLMAIRSPHP